MEVSPGTVAVWSDLGCPWSHAVVWRLHDARTRLGLDGRVAFDHHAFPLELFNNEPTPRPQREAEGLVAAELAPRAGWQPWSAPAHAWPVTMLLPMEAVQAAKLQSWAASEELDRGLRRAFWGESRCISLRHVILEVANECDSVDVAALSEALDDGRARRAAARRLGGRPRRRGARFGPPLRAGRHERAEPRHRDRLARGWRGRRRGGHRGRRSGRHRRPRSAGG